MDVAERSANAVLTSLPLHATAANYRTGCFEIWAAWFFVVATAFFRAPSFLVERGVVRMNSAFAPYVVSIAK
jgi:cytochrome c biogenesis factor